MLLYSCQTFLNFLVESPAHWQQWLISSLAPSCQLRRSSRKRSRMWQRVFIASAKILHLQGPHSKLSTSQLGGRHQHNWHLHGHSRQSSMSQTNCLTLWAQLELSQIVWSWSPSILWRVIVNRKPLCWKWINQSTGPRASGAWRRRLRPLQKAEEPKISRRSSSDAPPGTRHS